MLEIRTIAPSQEPIAVTAAIVTTLADAGAAEPITTAEAEAWIGRWAEFEQARILVAHEDGTPVAWLGVVPWPGEYASLHWLRGAPVGWPTVEPSLDAEEVGHQLLEVAADVVPEEVAALIMSIDRDVVIDGKRLATLQARYEALGWQHSEAVHFVHSAEGVTPPQMPEGLIMRPLREADPDQLTACIRDIFSGEYAAIFCGGLPEEQEAFLRGLPESETMNEAASVVLVVGDELVGFSSTHGIRENENLLVNWIGIRPAWRRRGYASILLNHILATAADEGYATASLSSEVRNQASLALYQSQGWEIEGGEKQFAKYLD